MKNAEQTVASVERLSALGRDAEHTARTAATVTSNMVVFGVVVTAAAWCGLHVFHAAAHLGQQLTAVLQ